MSTKQQLDINRLLDSEKTWPENLMDNFKDRISNKPITDRLKGVYLDICNNSWKNFSAILKNILDFSPASGKPIKKFIQENDIFSLKWVQINEKRIEIARAVNGVKSSAPTDLKFLPKEIFDLYESKKDSKESITWVAVLRFLRDIEKGRYVVATEESYFSANKNWYIQQEINHQIARGLFTDNECKNWKNNLSPYPFPVSGSLRTKSEGKFIKSSLEGFEPIIITIAKPEIIDRAIYTFGDAMLPPLLTEHQKLIIAGIKKNPLRGYTITQRQGKRHLEAIHPKAIKQGEMALPEAMGINLLMDNELSTLKNKDGDYIEAKITGGFNFPDDAKVIHFTKDAHNLLLYLLPKVSEKSRKIIECLINKNKIEIVE